VQATPDDLVAELQEAEGTHLLEEIGWSLLPPANDKWDGLLGLVVASAYFRTIHLLGKRRKGNRGACGIAGKVITDDNLTLNSSQAGNIRQRAAPLFPS